MGRPARGTEGRYRRAGQGFIYKAVGPASLQAVAWWPDLLAWLGCRAIVAAGMIHPAVRSSEQPFRKEPGGVLVAGCGCWVRWRGDSRGRSVVQFVRVGAAPGLRVAGLCGCPRPPHRPGVVFLQITPSQNLRPISGSNAMLCCRMDSREVAPRRVRHYSQGATDAQQPQVNVPNRSAELRRLVTSLPDCLQRDHPTNRINTCCHCRFDGNTRTRPSTECRMGSTCDEWPIPAILQRDDVRRGSQRHSPVWWKNQ
jgi:hypothetical protein